MNSYAENPATLRSKFHGIYNEVASMLRSTAFPNSVGELHNMYGHYHDHLVRFHCTYDDNSYIGHHQLEYL